MRSVISFFLLTIAVQFAVGQDAPIRIGFPKADSFPNAKKAIEHYTDRIAAAKDTAISNDDLALLYKYRGMWWSRWNKEMHAVTKTMEKPPASDLAQVDADIKDFTESLRLNPLHADTYVQRGRSWYAMGTQACKDPKLMSDFLDEAIINFDSGLLIDATASDAYLARAEARAERVKLDIAKAKAELCQLRCGLGPNPPSEKLAAAKEKLDARKARHTQANKQLKQATEEYKLKKDHWTKTSEATKAKDDLELFKLVNDNFNAAKKALQKATAAATEAKEEEDAAAKKLAKLNFSVERRELIKHKVDVHSRGIQKEFELLLGDYNDAIRRTPGTAAEAVRRREAAIKVWEEAKKDLADSDK